MNTTGQRIIDAIITGKLCHASCAHDPNHGCIVVWSSGSAEQIDALANTETDVLRQERDQLRARVVELEQDKAQLDWLLNWNITGHPFKTRAAIDAAKGQP